MFLATFNNSPSNISNVAVIDDVCSNMSDHFHDVCIKYGNASIQKQ